MELRCMKAGSAVTVYNFFDSAQWLLRVLRTVWAASVLLGRSVGLSLSVCLSDLQSIIFVAIISLSEANWTDRVLVGRNLAMGCHVSWLVSSYVLYALCNCWMSRLRTLRIALLDIRPSRRWKSLSVDSFVLFFRVVDEKTPCSCYSLYFYAAAEQLMRWVYAKDIVWLVTMSSANFRELGKQKPKTYCDGFCFLPSSSTFNQLRGDKNSLRDYLDIIIIYKMIDHLSMVCAR